MNKENEQKISKARREMERINAEWEALNVECKCLSNVIAGLGADDDAEYFRLDEALDSARVARRALGDQHAVAMAEYMDAVTAHLKEVREGGDLPQETQKGESK